MHTSDFNEATQRFMQECVRSSLPRLLGASRLISLIVMSEMFSVTLSN